jgi:hypothetical protein
MSGLKKRIVIAVTLAVFALSLSGCVPIYIPTYVGMT